jgi:S-DNA-T family DNA segregation ATPase FtsK/SpoIIIE
MSTTDEFRSDETGKVIAFPTGRPAKSSSPEIVDAELVDEHPPATVVDTPTTDGSSWLDRVRTQDRQPIIPPYLRSLAEAKQAATWVGKHYAHKAGYHAARTPLYTLRLAVRSPRGLLLLLAATGRYVTDAEGRPARSETATADKAELYLKLSQQRDRRVVLRWIWCWPCRTCCRAGCSGHAECWPSAYSANSGPRRTTRSSLPAP